MNQIITYAFLVYCDNDASIKKIIVALEILEHTNNKF